MRGSDPSSIKHDAAIPEEADGFGLVFDLIRAAAE
jgi:hypothetical protein